MIALKLDLIEFEVFVYKLLLIFIFFLGSCVLLAMGNQMPFRVCLLVISSPKEMCVLACVCVCVFDC